MEEKYVDSNRTVGDEPVTRKQYRKRRQEEEDVSDDVVNEEFDAMWAQCEEKNLLHGKLEQVFIRTFKSKTLVSA